MLFSGFTAGQLAPLNTGRQYNIARTGAQDARLVVIRPLAYRPRKGSRLLYRNPVYLLSTDPELPIDRLLQSCLW
jgi:hypothetical protein